VADDSKGKKVQIPSLVVKTLVLEVKEIPKFASPFNFEYEIQKIRIPIPLSELVKHEYFKISLSKLIFLNPQIIPHTQSICKTKSQQLS
jgi:hypothetical protein